MTWWAVAVLLAGCNSPQAATRSTSTSASPSASVPDAGAGTGTRRLRVEGAEADADALALIRARRLAARSDLRTLVVYVGARWCEPCRRFEAEVASGRLDARLGRVTLLEFDADRDAERLAAAGYSFTFIPFVALPGADGHPTDSQAATGKGSEAWREMLGSLERWQGGEMPR